MISDDTYALALRYIELYNPTKLSTEEFFARFPRSRIGISDAGITRSDNYIEVTYDSDERYEGGSKRALTVRFTEAQVNVFAQKIQAEEERHAFEERLRQKTTELTDLKRDYSSVGVSGSDERKLYRRKISALSANMALLVLGVQSQDSASQLVNGLRKSGKSELADTFQTQIVTNRHVAEQPLVDIATTKASILGQAQSRDSDIYRLLEPIFSRKYTRPEEATSEQYDYKNMSINFNRETGKYTMALKVTPYIAVDLGFDMAEDRAIEEKAETLTHEFTEPELKLLAIGLKLNSQISENHRHFDTDVRTAFEDAEAVRHIKPARP